MKAQAGKEGSLKETAYLEFGVLLFDEHQPRTYFDPEAIAKLGKSIKKEGQQQLVKVSPAKGRPGFFYIKHGESRVRSVMKEGAKGVLCYIDWNDEYDGQLNVSRVLGQAVENQRRKGHTHSELVHVMALVLTEEKSLNPKGHIGRAEKRFADALGEKSDSWAQGYRTLVNLHPDLLKLIDTKGSGLTFLMGVELARNEQSEQHIVLEEARRMNTTDRSDTLFKHIGAISRKHRAASGKYVRERKSDQRAMYFAFFNKMSSAVNHLVGGLSDKEFEKFEAECLSYGTGDRARQVLPQARELLTFLQDRVNSLEDTLKK